MFRPKSSRMLHFIENNAQQKENALLLCEQNTPNSSNFYILFTKSITFSLKICNFAPAITS